MFRILFIAFSNLCSFFIFTPTFAQVHAKDDASLNKFIALKDGVTFDANGSVNGLKLSEISGSPFWNIDYTLADLYKDEKKTARALVKVNLFTNEIYLLKGKEELVLEEQGINQVIFFKAGDTTKLIRRVPNMFMNKSKVDDFVQVMNTGRYQLLKYTKKQVGIEDSAMNYKRYFFGETNYYFLKNLQKVERIRKLDYENVLSYLPLSNTLKGWIETNHIDFRKEKDIILFLNHYNGTLKK